MQPQKPVSAPPLCGDPARVDALRRYGILDTPREAEFDDITRVIAHICQTPIALINFIDSDRQFFKSEVGLGVREIPLEHSICAHGLVELDLFVIPDLTEDPRFAGNPLVTGNPFVRFYAGAPLRTPEGLLLGNLCVLDFVARELAPAQLDALKALARQVMTQMELRRVLAQQSKLMAEREKIKDELDRTVFAKDQFLAELSHELRTPLNPVLMTATAMETDPGLPEAFREDVLIIRRNVELEVRLIDDLLDLTRISCQKMELRQTTVNAQKLLRETLQMCAADLTAKKLNCITRLNAMHEFIHTDPTRLHQIFANLLRNSIKFTPDRGTITITTFNLPDNSWTFEIKDTGIGIEPQRLTTVFNAYEQGDRTVTRRFGGLGLGLAITKALVEMQGGTISATSDGAGHGATFTVTFPTVQKTSPEIPPPDIQPLPAVAPPPRRCRKILLVEDNAIAARVMTRLLRQMSHEVSTVHDIAAALHAAENETFDLLISDVGLPDGSGLDLIRDLKQRQSIAGIAVTGYGMEEDIRSCHEAGFLVHLTKPISAAQLEAAIAQVNR